MRSRRLLRSLTAYALGAVSALSCLSAPALGQFDNGGRGAPDSPAGIEYTPPLERAREEAGGGEAASPPRPPGGGGRSTLFGEGVEQRDSAGTADGPSQTDGSLEDGADVKPTATHATDGDGSEELLIGGIAIGVVLVGGGSGLLLARARRS